jgi:ADP-ribosylglycohydrolase
MANLNHCEFYDKVYGCWIGKSIGGTFGAPYEGRQELLDVHNYSSPPGKPMPNDDLDLQLVWLKALEDRGPLGVNEHVLGEYWINYISPHWNEYGIGKSNMKAGLLPPLSGDYQNNWKHSNGAWIRSEIWACCAPGCPEIATKYAGCDACVDHGTGEGTYAELFMASVESAAFIEPDRDKLIQIGLTYIPSGCRVARSIGIVLDSYAKGLDWKDARRLVLDDSADLGWFQAPANVAFVIIGWLYGEGDYKNSLSIAVSCGDDTDCTGATLGSILGILAGSEGIPQDWRRYIGDDIITCTIDRGSWVGVPPNCTALTGRVVLMAPQILAAHSSVLTLDDSKTNIQDFNADTLAASPEYIRLLSGKHGALRFDFLHTKVFLSYISGVEIEAGRQAIIEITLQNVLPDPRHVDITYFLPEGFELVEGKKHIFLFHKTGVTSDEYAFRVTLQAGHTVQSVNRGVIQMVAEGRPTVMLIPLLFFGA